MLLLVLNTKILLLTNLIIATMKITYENIEHLIYKADEDDGMMYCQFKDPNTDAIVKSQARIERVAGTQKRVEHIAKSNAFFFLRSQLMNAIYKLLGSNLFSHTVRQMAWEFVPKSPTLSDDDEDGKYSESEKREAITEAFRRIASQFERSSDKWYQKQESPPFEDVFQKNPIKTKYDRHVLARMLIELASTDGALTAQEKTMLSDFVAPDLGSIETLTRYDALSAVELDETTPAVRESMYLLAWTMAVTDNTLSAAEKSLLRNYGLMFNLPNKRCDELATIAKQQVVETAIANDFDRATILGIADQIELNRSDAERTVIRYQKRNG